LSRSEPGQAPLTFDAWVAEEFARTGGFTALVVLVSIGDVTVTPLRSAWFHVVGHEFDWAGVAALLDGAGVNWDGALFAPRADRTTGGPLQDAVARLELRDLGDAIAADRTVLNAEHFFDRRGRRMQIEEIPTQ
jgi:hypothetical protein